MYYTPTDDSAPDDQGFARYDASCAGYDAGPACYAAGCGAHPGAHDHRISHLARVLAVWFN